MSSKKVKGTKLNYSAFVSSTGGISTQDDLPTAPSGLPPEDRHRGGSRWGKSDGDGGDGYGRRQGGGGGRGRRDDDEGYEGGDGDQEDGPSRADEATAWRRAPDPNEGRATGRDDRGGSGSRYGGRGGGDDRSGSDRYPSRAGGTDSDRRYGSDGDRNAGGDGERERDFSAFRRRDDEGAGAGGGRDGPEGPEPARADAASDWRSSRAAAVGGSRDDESSSSFRRNVGDADAEWRKFPLRDRDGGGGRGFDGGGRMGGRGDDGGFDRRPYGGGGRFGRDGRENGDEREERGGAAGAGSRYDRDRAGYDREGGRGGYDRDGGGRGGYDRDGGGGGSRAGFDRGDRSDRYDSRPGARRGDNLPTDEELERRAAERPAHLRQLLKKPSDGGTESAAGAAGAEEGAPAEGVKKETALERMEREAAERERAERELVRGRPSDSDRGERERERPAAGPPAVDDRPRRFGLGRTSGEEGSRGGSLEREEVDAPNKVPELAPIKLSALRKNPSAAAAAESSLSQRSQLASSPSAAASALPPAPAHPPPVIDDSRYSDELRKTAVSARKQNPLDRAIHDKQSVTEAELKDGLASLSLGGEAGLRREVGVVVGKSLVDGKVGLDAVVRLLGEKGLTMGNSGVLVEALKVYNERKGDQELLKLVQDSTVNVLNALMPPSASAADTDAFLAAHSLLVLKPIHDLTGSIQALLSSSASAQQLVDALNAQLSPSAPIPELTKLISAHVFSAVFAPPAAPATALTAWLPLLSRVGNTAHSRLVLLYSAQQAWFQHGAAKAVLKDVFSALLNAKVVQAADVLAWRDDLKEGKGVGGKPKALLQVNAWVKAVEEEENKRRPREEEEEDEEDEDEDEDDEDDDY